MADDQKLVSGSGPPLSKRAQLLSRFYTASTLVKRGSLSVTTYRMLFVALGALINACRREIAEA